MTQNFSELENTSFHQKDSVLKLQDFSYDLPESLIAQSPHKERSSARLLQRNIDGSLSHHQVFDLPSIFPEGSLLLYNDTEVFPSRLIGHLETGGKVEIFLLNLAEGVPFAKAKALGRPLKKLKIGTKILFSENIIATITAKDISSESPFLHIQFNVDEKKFQAWADKKGYIPLPPYIKRNEALPASESMDKQSYQTVYSQHLGSTAAPTAGLHFTPELIKKIEESNIHMAPVTLHVGAGTFLPVKHDDIDKHHMHTESYRLPKSTLAKINLARKEGRPIISIGTTTLRCVESFYLQAKRQNILPEDLVEKWHETNLFVHPMHKDDRYCTSIFSGIMTNFHQPCSTLLMLISALIGFDNVKNLYREAVDKKYRFFSYGDSSLLWFEK